MTNNLNPGTTRYPAFLDRSWIVTEITYSERSGLMIRGENLHSEYSDKGFSWHMGAKEFAADLARNNCGGYDVDYATITHPRAARLCAFFGIKIPCAVGVTAEVF